MPEGWDGPDDGSHAAAARAEVAVGRVLARRRIIVGCISTGVLLRRRLISMHLVVCLHVVVSVFSDDCRRARSLTFRTQHGRRHCAPDGEQDGQQDQDEEAEVFHDR